MRSKHYWPDEPHKTHFLCHKDGGRHVFSLDQWGYWYDPQGDPSIRIPTSAMIDSGYLGVRTPFSEEDERVEFEKSFYGCDFTRDESGLYRHKTVQGFFVAWLAAKRHERGVK
jgi:hypothetical protein